MVGTDLTPTAVLCTKNRGREEEAMEVTSCEGGKPPTTAQGLPGRVKAGLPAQGHTSARTGHSCCTTLRGNSPKGRQGSCPNFNSLWDSWSDCGQHSTCSAPALNPPQTSQPQYASSAAAFPRAGLASLAESGHRPTALDSNWFMRSQYRPAEVFLHLGARIYFVAAETLLPEQPGAERMHR